MFGWESLRPLAKPGGAGWAGHDERRDEPRVAETVPCLSAREQVSSEKGKGAAPALFLYRALALTARTTGSTSWRSEARMRRMGACAHSRPPGLPPEGVYLRGPIRTKACCMVGVTVQARVERALQRLHNPQGLHIPTFLPSGDDELPLSAPPLITSAPSRYGPTPSRAFSRPPATGLDRASAKGLGPKGSSLTPMLT